MTHSAPDPVLRPVPRWERVAAGGLFAWLVAWTIHWHRTPREWVLWLQRVLGILRQSAVDWLATRSLNPAKIIHSNAPLDAMSSSLMLLNVLALPVLIGWSVAVALGCVSPRWRTGLWWMVFANGVAGLSEVSVSARSQFIFVSSTSPEASRAWWEGWFRFLEAPIDGALLFELVPYLVETLLAAVVLWFIRKKDPGLESRSRMLKF
jgi:hypothetical protein